MWREPCPIAGDYPEHYRAVSRMPSTLAQALASSARTGQCALVPIDNDVLVSRAEIPTP
jgi:hypothetical protein